MLLASVMLLQSVGAARAMSMDSVHCCCGTHSVARVCACLHCPIALKRQAQRAHVPDEETMVPVGACHPSVEDGALVVLATLPTPPSLAVTLNRGRAALVTEQLLLGRDLTTPRPPP